MDGVIHLKAKIQKIFSTIILIHPYVFELKISLDTIIGQ